MTVGHIQPDISVVVSTYRRPHLLPRLVAALEAQDLDPSRFEVLIVDNASGDDTSAVLTDLAAATHLNLRLLTMATNRGPGPARNHGWRNARAHYVAFTDDDCVPEPRWLSTGLATIAAHPEVGVLQGCTLLPDDQSAGSDWTLRRQILTPSPYFEGCNLFFRRAALETGGGFDEDIGFGCEDTVAGWSALSAGWERDFDELAVVRHDLVDRGLRFHLMMAWREGMLVDVASRYPRLRTEGFWQPWAHRRRNVAFLAAVVGVAGAAADRRTLVLVLPWVWDRRNGLRHRRPWKIFGGWLIEDACVCAGMLYASIRNRTLVL